MKIGAIIQARTSSTRLHGKVLKELPYNSGINILQQVVRRLKKSRRIDEIIVATTTEEDDNSIVDTADMEEVTSFRGSKNDVLKRYYDAAKKSSLDVIVRITSDCPCIDPEIVDVVIEEHLNYGADYTSNLLVSNFPDVKRTYPHGMDTEVMNYHALERAHLEAMGDFEREHVCTYIYGTKKASFRIRDLEAPSALHYPDIRITVDTEDDYALLCTVFDYLYPENHFFKARDIVNLFEVKPWLKLINNKTVQKKIFETFEEEAEEALRILDLQDLKMTKKFLEENRFMFKNHQASGVN